MSILKQDINSALCFAFFLSLGIYLSTLHLRPYLFSYLIKIIPLCVLIVFSVKNFYGINKKLMISALVLSAIGDVILALEGREMFVYGLGAFAVAHCFYIISFLLNKVCFNCKRVFIAVLFFIYSLVIMSILGPYLKNMLAPVIIYISIITMMGVSATLAGRSNLYMITGGVMFILSDSIIAINMFLSHVPHSSYWIMLTYFPAQFFIIFGNMKRLKNRYSIDSITGPTIIST